MFANKFWLLYKEDMRKLTLLALIFLAACSSKPKTTHVVDTSKQSDFLFVISAKEGKYQDSTLTLDATPLVIYFADRPHRVAGHIPLKEFIKNWDDEMKLYQNDPPNATLSLVEKKTMQNVVLELSHPRYKDGKLCFQVKVLENTLPKSFGLSSLFLDMASVNIRKSIPSK